MSKLNFLLAGLMLDGSSALGLFLPQFDSPSTSHHFMMLMLSILEISNNV
jgi:hypothetical protein